MIRIKTKLKLVFTVVLLVSGFYLTAQSLFAESFVIQQLTNSFGIKFITDIDQGRFVWTQTTQVYLYDGSKARQLTSDAGPIRNVGSRIDGDYVVWVKEDTSGTTFIPQVYLYNISTGETTQITDDSLFLKALPDVNQASGKIVWMSLDLPGNVPGVEWEIVEYDIATGQMEFITNDSIRDLSPVISDDLVAWRKSNGYQNIEIYIKDLSTDAITRLTNNLFIEKQLVVHGNNAAWIGYDGNDYEIFLYDGSQVIQVTDNDSNDNRVRLYGDKLVWQNGATQDIKMYTISTGETEHITNGGDAPDVSATHVAWLVPFDQPDGSLSTEVFVKNLSSGEITQVTEGAYVLNNTVHVGDGIVSWVGEPRDPVTGIHVFIATPSVLVDTQAGNDVFVSENSVDLTFSEVNFAGNTTVATSSSGTQPPTVFKLGNPPTYYNITTTATFSGTVEICINYDETTIQGNENNLKLLHFDQNWTDVTTSLDTVNNVICGDVASFSEFVLATTEPTIQDLIDLVEAMNLQQGIDNSLDAKLANTQAALDAERNNDIQVASNLLQSFINEVEAQRGNKITDTQADELILFAQNLISIIQGVGF